MRNGSDILKGENNIPRESAKVWTVFMLYSILVLGYFSYSIFHGLVLAPGDAVDYYYPPRIFLSDTIKDSGTFPSWNPYIFSGCPTLGDPILTHFYPFSIIFIFLSYPVAMNTAIILHYVLCAFFTFLYCRAIRCTVFASFFAGLAFGLGGFMTARIYYPNLIQACTWFPLLLFLLEKMISEKRAVYFGLGAAVLGLFLLSSFLQIFTYGTLFLIFYFIFFRRPRELWSREQRRGSLSLLGGFLIGILLCAVWLVPLYEYLFSQEVRKNIDYAYFTYFSFAPQQLLTLIFPYLFGAYGPNPLYKELFSGSHTSFVETACYAGWLPLILGTVAMTYWRKNRRAVFWTLALLGVLLLAFGKYDPLTKVLYHIPIYNRFRAPGRWLFIFSFALAVLSALGLTRLKTDPGCSRRVRIAAGSLVLLTTAAVVVMEAGWAKAGRWSQPAILIPVVMAVISGGGLWLYLKSDHFFSKIVLILILFLDLNLYGQFHGWQSMSPDKYFINQVRLEGRTLVQRICKQDPRSPGEFRMFSPNFLQENYGFVSRIESVNGYGAPLSRYSKINPDLVYHFYNQYYSSLLLDFPWILDMLNCRYMVSRTEGQRIQEGNFQFAEWELPWVLGDDKKEFFVDLGKSTAANHLGIVSSMLQSTSLQDGTPVAGITLVTEKGEVVYKELVAGRDTSEFAYQEKAQEGFVRHRQARIVSTQATAESRGNYYFTDLSWGAGKKIKSLSGRLLVPGIYLKIEGMSLLDSSTGRSSPVPCGLLTLDKNRWKPLGRFYQAEVYQNKKALARAWLVSEVRSLPEPALYHTLRTGRLPEGGSFEPGRTALVEQGGNQVWKKDPQAGIKMQSYHPDDIEMEAYSRAPSFLVLSEIYYPGWKAFLDGQETKIIPTDYLLRGLPLPAGSHRVKFIYRPFSLILGIVVSALTLILLGILAVLIRIKVLKHDLPRVP